MALGLATAPIIARTIGPEGRGLTAAAIAALALSPILIGGGLPMAVRRRAAAGSAPEVLRGARFALLALPIPGALIGVLISQFLFETMPVHVRVIFVVGMAASAAYVSALCDQSVLIVLQRYTQVTVLQFAQPGLYTFAIVTGWLLGRITVGWVVGSFVIATIAASLVAWGLVRVSVRGPRAPTLPLVREGWSYAGSQIAESSSNRLDQMIMVSIIGAGPSGLYAVAVTIAAIPLTLGHAIGAVLFRDIATATGTARVDIEARGVRAGLVSGVISAGILAAVTPWAVPLIFGEAFAGAVPVSLVLLSSGPAVVAGYVATTSLGAENRGREMTIAQSAGLVVGLSLLFVLGPWIGAMGAAVASVLGYWVTALSALGALGLSARRVAPRMSDVRDTLRLLRGGY